MIHYVGVNYLFSLREYYLSRLNKAEDNGYAAPSSTYFWLYQELILRVQLITQTIDFISKHSSNLTDLTLPEIIDPVMLYSACLFSGDDATAPSRNEAGSHPIFNCENPYWIELNQIFDHIKTVEASGDRTSIFTELIEYLVRAVRLYLQIRELYYFNIDRSKFYSLMKLESTA